MTNSTTYDTCVLVLGYGTVGRPIVHALRTAGVSLVNVADPNVAEAFTADVLAEPDLIRNYQYVINTIPVHDPEKLVPLLVACVKYGVNYIDTNEDRETTRYVRMIAAGQKILFAPQSGLAPGLINVLGGHLWRTYKPEEIDLRVGALTRFVDNQYLYTPTWSPAGVVNQALNDFEIVENSVPKTYESVFSSNANQSPRGHFNDFYHRFYLDGVQYECFPTSGGLGTMTALTSSTQPLRSLMYRSIRLAGHAERFRSLVHGYGFDRRTITKVFEEVRVADADDYVLVIARAKRGMEQTTIVLRADAGEYFGTRMTAIQKCTTAGVGAVLEMHLKGQLPSQFLDSHELDWDIFKTTQFVSLAKFD